MGTGAREAGSVAKNVGERTRNSFSRERLSKYAGASSSKDGHDGRSESWRKKHADASFSGAVDSACRAAYERSLCGRAPAPDQSDRRPLWRHTRKSAAQSGFGPGGATTPKRAVVL